MQIITSCFKKLFKIRTTAITLLLVLSAMSAKANDGVYYTKGTQLVPLTETDISVRKEVLTISIGDDGFAHVDVYYEFWNPGKEVKRVLMGFEADPSYNDDWKFYPSGVHPRIKDFTIEMNGRRLSYGNAPCVALGKQAGAHGLERIDTTKRYYVFDNNMLYEEGFNAEEGDNYKAGIAFAYVYYFNADFQPGLNKVHHTYTYRMSWMVGVPYIVDYKLSPAARWANGRIDDFTLVIRADNTAKNFFIPEEVFPGAEFCVSEGMGKIRRHKLYSEPAQEFTLRNGAVTLHLQNFTPKKELRISGAGLDCCYNVDTEGGASLFLAGAYDRSRVVIMFSEEWMEGMKVVPEDKAFQKRVLRNLPYAHRGHVFKDARLKKFFESLWWYMPNPAYKDSTDDFTPVDFEYINAGK